MCAGLYCLFSIAAEVWMLSPYRGVPEYYERDTMLLVIHADVYM